MKELDQKLSIWSTGNTTQPIGRIYQESKYEDNENILQQQYLWTFNNSYMSTNPTIAEEKQYWIDLNENIYQTEKPWQSIHNPYGRIISKWDDLNRTEYIVWQI